MREDKSLEINELNFLYTEEMEELEKEIATETTLFLQNDKIKNSSIEEFFLTS